MDVHAAKELLEDSKEFKDFKKDNPEFYFVHAFWMNPGEQWKLGYYGKKTDKIIVFDVGDTIFKNPEEDVFKEKGQVQPLDLAKVKITRDTALQKALDYIAKSGSAELVKQTIVILQCLEKPLWNVTLVTSIFNIINVRVDAKTGEIIETNAFNVLSTGSGGLGRRA